MNSCSFIVAIDLQFTYKINNNLIEVENSLKPRIDIYTFILDRWIGMYFNIYKILKY